MVSVLAGLAAGAASNAMAEWHAGNQFRRESYLMDKQNQMNRANALSAYSDQVQGAKMAGLSPALLNGQTPNVASPVSKGTVSQAENVEFDPATLLLQAQKDNLDAQTEKTQAETDKIKGVDTANIEADTNLKIANALLAGANKDKVIAESTQIGNVNKVFAEENSAMSLFGQTTAQGWMQENWYNKLPKGAKMVISDIAKGDFDLTVGFANALDRMVSSDVSMNSAQKEKASFALTRAVIEGQMKSPKVMQALVKTPQAQYSEVLNLATKYAQETQALKFELGWSKERKDVWSKNDPDKLYAEYQKDPTIENAVKWLVGSFRSTGAEVLKGATPAVIHGGAMNDAFKNSKNSKEIKNVHESHTPALYGSDGSILRPAVHTQGIEKMRF